MDNRTCRNCVWGKQNSEDSSFGCWYKGKWIMWLDKKKAEMFPLCIIKDNQKLVNNGCKWSDNYDI